MRTLTKLTSKDLAKIAEMLSYAGFGYNALRQRINKARSGMAQEGAEEVEIITHERDELMDPEDLDIEDFQGKHKLD